MTTQIVPISLPLGDWLFIDAVMDNSEQSARDADDDQVATKARAIRHIGWDTTGDILRPIFDAGQRPPSDDVMRKLVTMSLTADDWRFVVDHLRSGAAIADSVDQPDNAVWGRRLADKVAERLAERQA
jgi:hypothetical protein